jgi:hypothetical protein
LDRDPVEDRCLALLLQEPELGNLATSLRLEHFNRPENREVMAYWYQGHEPELMDEDLRPHWDRLVAMPMPPSDRSKRETDLQDSVARLEARYLRRLADEDRLRLEEASTEEKDEERSRLTEASLEELERQYEDVLQRHERMRQLLAETVR